MRLPEIVAVKFNYLVFPREGIRRRFPPRKSRFPTQHSSITAISYSIIYPAALSLQLDLIASSNTLYSSQGHWKKKEIILKSIVFPIAEMIFMFCVSRRGLISKLKKGERVGCLFRCFYVRSFEYLMYTPIHPLSLDLSSLIPLNLS